MVPGSLSTAVVSSANAIYDYLQDMQWVSDPPKGVSETRADSVDIMDGYAILHLSSALSDTSGLMLKVGKRILTEEESDFRRYDDVSKTILVHPGEDVLAEMASDRVSVSVVSDMKFLIIAVRDFFKTYGDHLELPSKPRGEVHAIYPDMGVPSREQEVAAEGMLEASMAYVWGAPGTGKTQFVLSSAIRGCLDAGERVAVFAPTNNSVEQVLRGILDAIPEKELGEVIRLGVPTKQFYKEHPGMCEDRQVQRLMDRALESLSNLEELQYERACESIREDIDRLSGCDAWGLTEKDGLDRDSVQRVQSVKAVCRLRRATASLADADDTTPKEFSSAVGKALFDRERPALHIAEYSDMTDGDIREAMQSLEEEICRLRGSTTGGRITTARVIAATPQQFIARFRPKGSEEDGRMELDVDRIFLDEAGYCGLIQALSLFTNGVPVVMLGDHMQLPPVSEMDDEDLRRWASGCSRLEEAFLWSMPALSCERALTAGIQGLKEDYLGRAPPGFVLTSRFDLTKTRRFGSNLAEVLDRFVYRNGLTGVNGSRLDIMCIDAVCDHRENRENRAEAEGIRAYLGEESPDPRDVCVLTPYSVQCSLLRSRVPRRYRDCVMTVHGSQGREWDTVILSVADNGIQSRDVPYRFTSSETQIGLKVINTAVSRAKKRLVIVCDRAFWSQRDGELIRGLIEVCEGDAPPRLDLTARGRGPL